MTKPVDVVTLTPDQRLLLFVADARCPTCRMSWWLFPPCKIHGEDKFRCIDCKDVFPADVLVQMADTTAPKAGNGEGA